LIHVLPVTEELQITWLDCKIKHIL